MSDPGFGLGQAELGELAHALSLTRAAQEQLDRLREQGHVTSAADRSRGREAGPVGAAFAMRRRTDGTGDFVAPTVRGAGALFLFGGEPVDFFRQHLARAGGPTRGREANVHWFDEKRGLVAPISPLGTMVEVMAGITLAFRVRGEERVGLVFEGNEAASTGAWHEGLNFAAAQGCPMVLVVETDAPSGGRDAGSSFTSRGPGYGIGAETADGTDVLAVFDTVRRAAALARAGGGTQLVEVAYPDPGTAGADPVDDFHMRMVHEGWASRAEVDAIEAEARETVREAAARALAEAEPEGPEALHGVYTDVDIVRPWTRVSPVHPAGV